MVCGVFTAGGEGRGFWYDNWKIKRLFSMCVTLTLPLDSPAHVGRPAAHATCGPGLHWPPLGGGGAGPGPRRHRGVTRGGCPGPLPSRPCGKPGVFPALVGPHPRPRAEPRGCWASWGLLLFPCRLAVWCSNETLCVPGRTWTALWLRSLDGAGSITGVEQRGQELPTPQGVCPD